MCGIAGIFNYGTQQPIDKSILKNMSKVMVHRGPDDDGIFISDDFCLGLAHRRLSIIDLEGGIQPMSTLDKSIWIVFNGEIYNFPELKEELISDGYQFQTNSDTEVILILYQKYGEGAWAKMNGIFSFALYDTIKQNLFLVRDHFGVKPLYYVMVDGRLIFASELKSILQYPNFRRSLDLNALNSFLTFRYNPSPQTLFKGIRKLEAAHYIKMEYRGNLTKKNYWSYRPETDNKISEQDAVEQYQFYLEQAVKRQLLSDVPVGLFLSGGVDSAVIGHLMQKHSKQTIKTFTIGFPGIGGFNELDDAKASAEFIGSDHYETTISEQNWLEFLIESYRYTEEPIAIPTIPALYYVSKLAAAHGKVVLSGQGADEPLAGYNRYRGEQILSRYSKLLRLMPLKTVDKLFDLSHRNSRAIYASQFSRELERFLAICTIFKPADKVELIKPEILEAMVNEDLSLITELYAQTNKLDNSLNKLLYIDTRSMLSDNLLLFGDKITMANSLECRVPFLDLDLVKFVESLPAHFKLNGKIHKYIHKISMDKWLPDHITYRQKRGFQVNVDFKGDLGNKFLNLIERPESGCGIYFDINHIQNLIKMYRLGKKAAGWKIFSLFSFELWYDYYMNNYNHQ